jgi:hypothetical protein
MGAPRLSRLLRFRCLSRSLSSPCLLLLVWALAVAACQPAAPPAVAEAVEPDEIWKFGGELQVADNRMDFFVIVTRDPRKPSGYVGTIDIPKQALHGAGLVNVDYQPGQRLAFELPLPGNPHWVGVFGSGESIACEFSQAGSTHPCSMSSVRPQPIERLEPVRPPPVSPELQ